MIDDTISRQMAIDRFENLAYDDWNQGVSTTWANAFAECAEIISRLPTAEPQIIRCKDCKHYQFSVSRAFVCYVNRCEITGFEDVDDDDFCSKAERTEDG